MYDVCLVIVYVCRCVWCIMYVELLCMYVGVCDVCTVIV